MIRETICILSAFCRASSRAAALTSRARYLSGLFCSRTLAHTSSSSAAFLLYLQPQHRSQTLIYTRHLHCQKGNSFLTIITVYQTANTVISVGLSWPLRNKDEDLSRTHAGGPVLTTLLKRDKARKHPQKRPPSACSCCRWLNSPFLMRDMNVLFSTEWNIWIALLQFHK